MAQVLAWVPFTLEEWNTFDEEEWAVFVIHILFTIDADIIGPEAYVDGNLHPAPNITVTAGCISVTGQVYGRLNSAVFVGPVTEIVIDVDFGPSEIGVELLGVSVDVELTGEYAVSVSLDTTVTVLMGDGSYVDFAELDVEVLPPHWFVDTEVAFEFEVFVELATVTLLTGTGHVISEVFEIDADVDLVRISVDIEAGSYEYLVDAVTTQ